MNLIFADRILPNGKHVLIPTVQLPRTCRRADGVPKRAYHDRKAARAAKCKNHQIYRCRNCGEWHLASK